MLENNKMRSKVPCKEKGTLMRKVFEIANLIYLENIPEDVANKLNEELRKIEENDLEGTILLLESLKEKADYLKAPFLIGSYFSHCLVAYLLGLNVINPMDDVNDAVPYFNNKSDSFKFEIFVPQDIILDLQETIKNLGATIYPCSTYQKGKERELGIIPDTYYLAPKHFDILKVTSLKKRKDQLVPTAPYEELSKIFVTLRFRPTSSMNRIFKLSQKTKIFLEDISLEDKKVLKNSYHNLPSNEIKDYKSQFHYNVFNLFSPELYVCFKEENIPNSIYEFINLQNKENSNWMIKILCYYYDSYYRTYYEYDYYTLYLQELLEHFIKTDTDLTMLLEKVNRSYEMHTLKEEIEKENDAGVSLIMTTINILYEKDKHDIVKNVIYTKRVET